MNRSRIIKELLRKTYGPADAQPGLARMDERILGDASAIQRQAVIDNPRPSRTSMWRMIMDNRVTR